MCQFLRRWICRQRHQSGRLIIAVLDSSIHVNRSAGSIWSAQIQHVWCETQRTKCACVYSGLRLGGGIRAARLGTGDSFLKSRITPECEFLHFNTETHPVQHTYTHKQTLLITRLGYVHLYFLLRQPSNFNWAHKKPTLCFPQARFTFNCALKCRLSNVSKGWLVNVRRCLEKPRIHYTWPALLLLFQATKRCSSVLQKESRKEYINI